jgi:hypothetical protein
VEEGDYAKERQDDGGCGKGDQRVQEEFDVKDYTGSCGFEAHQVLHPVE